MLLTSHVIWIGYFILKQQVAAGAIGVSWVIATLLVRVHWRRRYEAPLVALPPRLAQEMQTLARQTRSSSGLTAAPVDSTAVSKNAFQRSEVVEGISENTAPVMLAQPLPMSGAARVAAPRASTEAPRSSVATTATVSSAACVAAAGATSSLDGAAMQRFVTVFDPRRLRQGSTDAIATVPDLAHGSTSITTARCRPSCRPWRKLLHRFHCLRHDRVLSVTAVQEVRALVSTCAAANNAPGINSTSPLSYSSSSSSSPSYFYVPDVTRCRSEYVRPSLRPLLLPTGDSFAGASRLVSLHINSADEEEADSRQMPLSRLQLLLPASGLS